MGGNRPDGGAPYREVTENGLSAPLDFSTTSPSSSSEDQQPVNLSERLLPAGSSPPNSCPADPNRKYPIKTDYTSKVGRHGLNRNFKHSDSPCAGNHLLKFAILRVSFSPLLTAQEAMTL